MSPLVFTVPGEVRGKGRPRIVKIGGFSRMAADKKTATYENLIALACEQAMGDAAPFVCPLSVMMTARMVPAASASRTARAAMLCGDQPPAKKPDADNLAKCLDALNGIAFRDDALIVSLFVRKVYAETPGLDIVIRPYVNPAIAELVAA